MSRNKPNIDSSNTYVEIHETLKLLYQGEKTIQLSPQHRNFTLFLGSTGAGKSTLVQWVVANNPKLHAKKVNGTLIIDDGDEKIGSSAIFSKTIYPELVINPETNSAFYDCPGFQDTRSTSYDIASTYFTKIVADHAEFINMIFVVNYFTVLKNNRGTNFMALMEHISNFIKDINKFRDSIAIIVTKVPNTVFEDTETGQPAYVSDEDIIAGIAAFFQEIKESLGNSSDYGNVSEKQKKLNENTIKFIDIILTKQNGNFSKIAIFRSPNKEAPLSKIKLLQKGKENIQRLINQDLKLVEKNVDDFGYTLSEKSKNIINSLAEEIQKTVWSTVNYMMNEIKNHYNNSIQALSAEIKSFVANPSNVHANFDKVKLFYNTVRKSEEIISQFKKINNSITVKELAQQITEAMATLETPKYHEYIRNVTNLGSNMEFLETMSNRKFTTKPWRILFENTEMVFTQLQENISNEIDQAKNKITAETQSNINEIANEIEIEFKHKLAYNILEFRETIDEIEKAQVILYKLGNVQSEQDLLMTIGDNIGVLKCDISRVRAKISKSLIGENYRNILGFISNGKINTTPKFTNPFSNVAQNLNELSNWYEFLNNLYNKLSDYDIQKDTSIYNVIDIEDWGHPNKPQDLTITSSNFNKFLDKIKTFNLKGYDVVQHTKVTEYQLEELNNVLSSTLRHIVNQDCKKNGELLVKGNYIKFSDFLQNNPNLNYENGTKVASLKIYATNAIIIDQDLQATGKELQLIIVSPKWIVEGQRKIVLDGAPGGNLETSEVWYDYYNEPGTRGEDGQPGLPGGPGGSFFGVGQEFINGANLKISSKGGDGGAGQDGGDGYAGRKGRLAGVQTGDTNFSKYRTIDVDDGFFSWLLAVFGSWRRWNKLLVYGTPGGSGGNGGDGGLGGERGYGGNVKILELGQTSKISSSTDSGTVGKCGSGGTGGLGGRDGDSTYVYVTWFNGAQGLHYESGFQYSNGAPGKTCVSANGMVTSKNPPPLPNSNQILNEYKNYLRENMNDTNSFKKYSTTYFYANLNNNKQIQNFYDFRGIIEEFKDIEEQYHKLNRKDLLFIYQHLSNEIIAYAPRIVNSEEKKMFSYLYTVVLSKIYSLKEDNDPTLIIDMKNYLKGVLKEIDDLRNLREKTSLINMVNDYKKAYNTNIAHKIKEAQSFIHTQVTPEINTINLQLADEINTLIRKTTELQRNAENNKQEAIKRKKDLQRSLPLNCIFSVAKFVGKALSLTGSFGEYVGAIIGTTSSVAEPLLIDSERGRDTESEIHGITKYIDLIENQIKEFYNTRVSNLNDRLEAASQELKKYPQKFNDTSAEIGKLWQRLENTESGNINAVAVLEKDLEDVLEKKKIELQSDNKEIDQLYKVIRDVIRQGEAISIGFYKYHKGILESSDEVNKAIEEADNQIRRISQYQKMIYTMVIPMLNRMKSNLEEVIGNLKTKSHVALDITKWSVKNAIKDIKLQMQQFTKGFEISENLARCLEKLDEAMTTLINVYDRIENYKEQKNLIDYIAHVNSPKITSIEIVDPRLSKEISDLEILLRSNLILKQYQLATSAFQKWIFPFAEYYLKSFPSLSYHKSDNVENLAASAIKQIQNIDAKLNEYKTSIIPFDKFVHKGAFGGPGTSSKPFFVWPNDKYQNIISKLLSGESVFLKANVLKSSSNKDAIKFNSIEINFKSTNQTQQAMIDYELRKFKMSLTHGGNSYYRYGDEYYVIPGDSQTIQLSFEKNSNGEPLHKNEVYDKLKLGDLLLSPYAMWQMQLIKIEEDFSYEKLYALRNQVDLELTGFGSYVSTNNTLELQVEDYYKKDNTAILDIDEEEFESDFLNDNPYEYVSHIRPRRSPSVWHNIYNYTLSVLPKIRLANYSTENLHLHDNRNYNHTNQLSNVTNSFDGNGNLILAQMIVGKVVGENKTLATNSFTSDEEKKIMYIEELATHVTPVLEQGENSFDYDDTSDQVPSQWYDDWLRENNSSSG